MGNRQDRLNEILNILRIYNGSTVKDLALMLHVSNMTIRRDISLLEDQGYLRSFHGSVVYNQEQAEKAGFGEYSIPVASTRNIRQKQNIGRRAASMVETGDVLLIDIGSTAEYIARSLPAGMPLTVICYGLNIVREVLRRPGVKLVCTGGQYHDDTQMLESSEGLEIIRRRRATKAFISAAGVDLRLGITTVNQYESRTKRVAMDSSLTRILIVDSSKFGKVFPAYFAALKDFDIVISNTDIDEQYQETCDRLGVELFLV